MSQTDDKDPQDFGAAADDVYENAAAAAEAG